MSEHTTSNPELREARLEAPERHEALPDPEHAEPLRPGEVDRQKLNQARQTVEQAAQQDEQTNPLQRLEAAEKAQQAPQPTLINQELKRITLQRELKQLQRRLPLPERTLSRVIHQPAIRNVSEAASQSLTRPSGLFGGGLVAFLGSSAYLYLAKHFGFRYNYLVFWLLFIAGFIFGVALEMIVWLLVARRHRSNS